MDSRVKCLILTEDGQGDVFLAYKMQGSQAYLESFLVREKDWLSNVTKGKQTESMLHYSHGVRSVDALW